MNPPTTDDRRHAPLDMTPQEFRVLGHDLVDRIADFLGGIRDRPLTRGESPNEIRALLQSDRSLPDDGADPAELLGAVSQLLFDHSLHTGHPRFLGYISSSAAPISMLGDLLAAAVNPNVGAWTLSPVASEIEAQAVRWIAELIGYPGDGGGLLVSGGNMANMAAFWAARVAAAGASVRTDGTPTAEPLVVYGSAETHTWIQKAADLAGLGTNAIRWVPTGRDLRMDVDALREEMDRDLSAGRRPMMVVGTGGSVSTGAVDPLREIAEVCRERGVWFHVDGAYGALAAMLPDAPEDLHHLALADSVAVDPHKWLYAPLEAGCVLVRDPQKLRDAFSYHPPYYHFGVEATNFVDLGPQNSRGFRALKVWLALSQVGRAGYVRMLSDDVRLAGVLHDTAEAHPELQTSESGLSISTFRFIPEEVRTRVGEPAVDAYLDELNKAVQARLEQDGEVFLSNAVHQGMYVLRGCIVNFRTTEEDVRAIPGIVVRVGREVHASLKQQFPAVMGAEEE